MTGRAVAAGPVVVEIGDSAASRVEPRLTRRLVALELADIVVPPPEGVAADTASLFFRLLPADVDAVRVELWQLGIPSGARNVSARGSPQLAARRIALAAAELARQLRHRRTAEARAREKESARAAAAAKTHPGEPIYGRLALEPAAVAVLVGATDAWLAGPAIAADLRFHSGPRLALEGRWLFGAPRGSSGSNGMEWLEIGVRPSFAAPLGTRTTLGLGLAVAAASVYQTGTLTIDGAGSARQSFSARGAGFAAIEQRLFDDAALRFGLEAGAVLRRLTVVEADGERNGIGGLWLGASLGIALDSPASKQPPLAKSE